MKPTSTTRRSLIVIGAASGAGAPDPATAEGPDALRHYRVFHDTPLQQRGLARLEAAHADQAHVFRLQLGFGPVDAGERGVAVAE